MEKLEAVLSKAKQSVPRFVEQEFRDLCQYAEKHSADITTINRKPLLENLLCVVEVLLDFNPDPQMLQATMLYHLPQSKKGTRLSDKLDDDVLELVENLRKISGVKAKKDEDQIAALRKMFVAMAKDIRVVMILLAERLCMMRSLDFFPASEQKEMARETLYIYAPIAGRLGVYALKAPLEDISFYYLHPEEYHQISEQLIRVEVYRDRIIRNAQKRLQMLLKYNTIKGRVAGRIKHIYSLYKKMFKKGEDSIDAVYDIFAMRIVVTSVTECYAVLGILHEHFVPLSGRFKDYIAVPKANGYRSLHTTVIGLSGITKRTVPIEVQIRTEEMNLEAEFGVAAHWQYKEEGITKSFPAPEKTEDWMDELLQMEISLAENPDFMQGHSEHELFDRVFALTPGGDVIDLPINATPIDFAFAIHSDLGLHIRVAKANGKSVPLNYIINNGDVVEIVTNKQVQPSQAWVTMCVTNKAKNKLKAHFREKDSGVLLREGKALLNRYLSRFGYNELDQNLSVLREYNGKRRTKKEREELLLKVGNGSLSPSAVIKGISEIKTPVTHQPKKAKTAATKAKVGVPKLIIGERADVPYRMAECCKPKTGDLLFGYVTRGTHVTIHRLDCHTRGKLDSKRFLEAYYEGYEPKQRVTLEISRGLDRVGFVRDVTDVLAGHGANISNFAFRQRSAFSAILSIEIEIEDIDHLVRVTNELEHVEGVEKIEQTR